MFLKWIRQLSLLPDPSPLLSSVLSSSMLAGVAEVSSSLFVLLDFASYYSGLRDSSDAAHCRRARRRSLCYSRKAKCNLGFWISISVVFSCGCMEMIEGPLKIASVG